MLSIPLNIYIFKSQVLKKTFQTFCVRTSSSSPLPWRTVGNSEFICGKEQASFTALAGRKIPSVLAFSSYISLSSPVGNVSPY